MVIGFGCRVGLLWFFSLRLGFGKVTSQKVLFFTCGCRVFRCTTSMFAIQVAICFLQLWQVAFGCDLCSLISSAFGIESCAIVG